MPNPVPSPTEQRLRAQSAEIATLAGGLAHEIRNPLSTISLNVELMTEELSADTDQPGNRRLLQRVKTIQRECQELERVLNEFLQFTRAGELELAPGDLNDLVREFIEFYQPQLAEHNIEVSPHLASDLPPVGIDRTLLRQALLNLAMNAQRAMPAGGMLELQTYRRNDRVALDLIDTGSGMDERTLNKMFEAFFSTRGDGSGLGLPTVKKIIEAHDGEILCESEVGRGTRFTLLFPEWRPQSQE